MSCSLTSLSTFFLIFSAFVICISTFDLYAMKMMLGSETQKIWNFEIVSFLSRELVAYLPVTVQRHWIEHIVTHAGAANGLHIALNVFHCIFEHLVQLHCNHQPNADKDPLVHFAHQGRKLGGIDNCLFGGTESRHDLIVNIHTTAFGFPSLCNLLL